MLSVPIPGSAGDKEVGLVSAELEVTIAIDTRRLESAYGPRFDRSAVVVSVRGGGTEFLDPRGLCDEFGLRGLGVLGFDEASVPEGKFIKIGVGVLRRDHPGQYSFIRAWPVAAGFPVEVEATSSALSVRQTSNVVDGYAFCLQKTYSLAGNRLTVAYALENRGERAFRFEHYNHNFISIAGRPADEAYRIEPGFKLPEDVAPWKGDGIGLRLPGPAPERSGVVWGTELAVPAERNRVRVAHEAGGALEIEGDFPVARFAVWASGRVLCPEVFHRAGIPRGETAKWTRFYRFETRKAE